MKNFFVFLFTLSFAWAANASEPVASGKVVSVVDGNTLRVMTPDNQTVQILLLGIDCPELTQAYGQEAKKYLEKILMNKAVQVRFYGSDRKGNRIAVVTTELDEDPRIELLREGLAWTSAQDDELEQYRSFAQQKKRGLWRADDPTPPWVYRRQQSMLQPKKS